MNSYRKFYTNLLLKNKILIYNEMFVHYLCDELWLKSVKTSVKDVIISTLSFQIY